MSRLIASSSVRTSSSRLQHGLFGGQPHLKFLSLPFADVVEVVPGLLAHGDLLVAQQNEVEELPHTGRDLVDLALVAVYGLAQVGPQADLLRRVRAEFEEALRETQAARHVVFDVAVEFGAQGIVVRRQVKAGHEARAHDHAVAVDLFYALARLDQIAVVLQSGVEKNTAG